MQSPQYYNRRMERDRIFDDLEWEVEVAQQRRQSERRRRTPVNLTAKIEDYIRSYM